MPKEFNQCVRKGGSVRTVSGPNKNHGLKKGEYRRYCFLKGKSFAGETKTKQWDDNLGAK